MTVAPDDKTREVENLLTTLKRMQSQQEAISLASLSDAFVTGDVAQLARETTVIVARATGVERANVWLFNEDETELRCLDLFEATPGDQAIPCGLAVNELLTNSLKHGFSSGRGGEARVVVRADADTFTPTPPHSTGPTPRPPSGPA